MSSTDTSRAVERVNVLVLMSSESVLKSIKTLPKKFSERYNFVTEETTFPTHQELLEFGKKIIKEKNISIVLSQCSDSRSLLKAALTQDNSFLLGPSFESVFLCVHKYYTHLMIDLDPVPYSCLDLSALDLDHECTKALENITLPAFVKPCTGYGSKGISVIQSRDDLKHVVKTWESKGISTAIRRGQKYINSFFTNNLDTQKYPLATLSTALVQKYMDMANAVCVNADGYVYDGEIFHWSMSDNIYSVSKPQCLLATTYPSNVHKHMQSKVWKLFDAVIIKLIGFGFNNSFVNVEVFVLQSGDVKLLEINPRVGGSLLALSKAIDERNVFLAELQLAEGVNPGCPEVDSSQHSLLGYVRTYGSGKSAELFDFDHAKSSSEFILDTCPEQDVDGSSTAGEHLARVCCSGRSREEVMDRYWSACHQVLIKPELSVWE